MTYNFLKITTGAAGVVALRKLAAGASMPPHTHPVIERNYLVSGRAQLLDGTIIEAGTYLEIPAGTRHGATALEDSVWMDTYEGSLVWVEDSGQMISVSSGGTFEVVGEVSEPEEGEGGH
ncbi:MAG: hypothetical protein BGO01_17955 [Armatimonadetes bacterium 55-13]|nr:MAG: hypothetical protein BGO01_17955 [Armatimonadetes bacterium 55-13]